MNEIIDLMDILNFIKKNQGMIFELFKNDLPNFKLIYIEFKEASLNPNILKVLNPKSFTSHNGISYKNKKIN